MYRLVNGKKIELTAEEITAMQAEQRKAEIAERTRPLTEAEVSRMLITEQINTLTVDDQTALRMREYYPDFDELVKRKFTAKDADYKFRYGDTLYKTAQPNIAFVAHYPPGMGTESMYTRIDETHDGSEYDPIPYEGNMALENGKYYTQNGVMYKCIRDTVNPVYNALADLVGLYVEIA
jgi:hypothetical protein